MNTNIPAMLLFKNEPVIAERHPGVNRGGIQFSSFVIPAKAGIQAFAEGEELGRIRNIS